MRKISWSETDKGVEAVLGDEMAGLKRRVGGDDLELKQTKVKKLKGKAQS